MPPAAGAAIALTDASRQAPTGRRPTGRDRSAPSICARRVDELDELLDRAAALTLRSDVPVGIFLSAGIDSSLVARAAVQAPARSRARSAWASPSNRTAKCPARGRPRPSSALPITEVTLNASALERFIDLVAHADDPLADSSALAVWTLAAETAKHVKVVLSGDGGDELFGGYLTYPATLWHASVTSRLPRMLRRAMAAAGSRSPTGDGKVTTSYKLMRYLRAMTLPPGEAHFSWNGTWLPDEAAAARARIRRRQACGAPRRSRGWPSGTASRATSRSAQLQRADLRDYLVNDILVKSDRMSMAHGLEVRAPFLDRRPGRVRAALAGRASRPAAAARASASCARWPRRRYGAEMSRRAIKQGFSIPVHEWLRGPARPLVDDLLSPSSVVALSVLEGPVVARAVADHLSGRRALGWELWGLMVLVAWHRQQIQRVPRAARDGAGLELVEIA